MSTQENVRVVKDFLAAIGSGDKQRLLALVAEDIEWIVPGENWPLAGTHCGHAGLADQDDLTADGSGDSRILMENYAIVVVDELERSQHRRERFTIGY